MDKNSKVLTVLVMMAVFIIGACSGVPQSMYYYDSAGEYVEITNPQEQCVLYRVLGSGTQAYKAGLFVVNYAAIKKGLYTGAEAVAELNFIEEEVVRPGATVGSVINAIIITAGKAAKAGTPELVLITEGLSEFTGSPQPLDDCTRYKLVAYIGSQRALSMAF